MKDEKKCCSVLKAFPSSFILPPSSFLSRVCHLFRLDVLVELLAGEVTQFDRRLAQGDALLVCVFRDLRRVVVAYVLVERRHEHERVAQVRFDLLAIEFYSGDAIIDEAVAGILDQANRVEQVMNHDGVEDVQLEVALRAREAYGRVVAEDLYGDHRHRLALRRIDLAGHDGRARLVLRQNQFPEARARPRSQPANIVRDLHERSGEGLQSAAGENQLVMRRQRGELVRGRLEGQTRQLSYPGRRARAEFWMRVESSADSRAADRQVIESRQDESEPFYVALYEAGPA